MTLEDGFIDEFQAFDEAWNGRLFRFPENSAVGNEHSVVLGSAVKQIDGQLIFMGTRKAVSELVVGMALRRVVSPLIFAGEVVLARRSVHVNKNYQRSN